MSPLSKSPHLPHVLTFPMSSLSPCPHFPLCLHFPHVLTFPLCLHFPHFPHPLTFLFSTLSSCPHYPHVPTSLMSSLSSCPHFPHVLTCLMSSLSLCPRFPHVLNFNLIHSGSQQHPVDRDCRDGAQICHNRRAVSVMRSDAGSDVIQRRDKREILTAVVMAVSAVVKIAGIL